AWVARLPDIGKEGRRMKRPWMVLLVSIVLVSILTPIAAPARAAVNVTRTGSENPMQEVAKSTIYGGAAGLILGAAVALVDDGSDPNRLRGGFAGGTFFAFAFGLYHVLSRPSAGAMIEVQDGKARFAGAAPAIDERVELRGARVRASFCPVFGSR